MSKLDNSPPNINQTSWQQKLDEFVATHHPELAALAWCFYQERKDSGETLGIDFKPAPHFVVCSQEVIETFNQKTDSKLQEILGIIKGYDPETEVLMIGIGGNSIKLVFFKPEITPPEHYEKMGKDLNQLLDDLKEKMADEIGRFE